jgi:sarcosine oxidase delta subunit
MDPIGIVDVECPFCGKKFKAKYWPPSIETHSSRSAAKSHTGWHRVPERYYFLSCPNCGKNRKEIEKKWKEGKELSREDTLKRLREAGLDPTKLR